MNHAYCGPARALPTTGARLGPGALMSAPHPTVAEQLVGYLERRGVRHVFGLCGHTNIAVLAAMAGSSIEFVNVRHEQVAAHAADGYARVTGRASVVLSHLSPGLTNAATGVANAALDCIPMVVIAGDVPVALLRPAPAPGGQPARRRVAVRDLSAVRQTSMAGRQGGAASRDHREGVPARRERPARAGARRRADGRLLATHRPGAVRPPRPRDQDTAPAVARRRDRARHRHPPRRGPTTGHLRRRRCAAVEGQRRAPTLRRPHGYPGRPQPDGQRRPQRRPPVGAWG